MIGVSTDYRQQLIAGNRNWVISVPVFLSGNNTNTPDFTLTNAEIWDNGIALDEAISSDSSFDLGAAIVGSLKVVIDNISGNFSSYDFYGAKLTLWLGVEGDEDNGTQRMYRIGFFVVDTPSYNGSLITLNCLDNMTWFDVPFDSVTGITYPANAGTVVQKICDTVGVTLGTPTFPNYSNIHTKVLAKPEQQLNCREMLQYIAQMCCCYCKINTSGQLVLAWYDKNAILNLHDYDGGSFSTTTTPYSDGDDVDGLHFNPWNIGTLYDGGTFDELRDRAFISQNYECDVSTDDVVITGVRVRNNTTKDATKAYDELWVDSTLEPPIGTHERYILVIDNNPLITKAKAGYIANLIGNTLAGLPIRGFSATSLADFSYETGDMATVVDFRGNRYYTWITHFTFTTNNSERFSCGVESIKKRSEQRFSGTVKTLAEANQNAESILTAYDNAVKAMDALAQNAIGYHEYIYTSGGSKTMYRYNGSQRTGTDADPKFPYSTAVFKISGDGVFVALAANGDIAADGTCTFSNGYDANSGTAILNLIYAQGLNAGWITAGTIDTARLNVSGIVNGINSGTTTINGGQITTDTIDTSQLKANAITTEKINANAVTSGKISVNNLQAVSSKMGTVNVGGDDNGNGELHVQNASSQDVIVLKNDGFHSYYEGNTSKGYTEINAGHVLIETDSNNYFKVVEKGNSGHYVTLGEHIAVSRTSREFYCEEDIEYLGWAVYDAKQEHSDRNIKKNIEDIPVEKSRELIRGARPRYYEFKETLEEGIRCGFIAQELRETLDKIGDNTAIERESKRSEGIRDIIYKDFIAHLVNTTQDLYKQVDELKQELAEMKARIK